MAERDNGRYIVAFEIGSSKVRGAIGLTKPTGVVDIIAVEEERITDKVRYGCIQNMEVSNALSIVAERLQAYPSVDPREITGAYIGLGGRSLWSSTTEVTLDLGEETEIGRPIINDLRHQAEASVDGDRDVVDVVPVRFTVDNKAQSNPIGTFGKQISATMTVLSCAPQLKKMLRRVVEERLGLHICDYVTRVLAEADMTLTDEERRRGCVFVDFGAETVTVAIYKNGNPTYVVTLPMGSRNITLDLTRLNYLEERAEEIKIAVGSAIIAEPSRHSGGGAYSGLNDGIDSSEVNNYVHARADEIIANIMAQIEYAGYRAEDLHDGYIIVGGGARLRGFNDLLAQQSNMKVRMGTVPPTVRLTDGSLSGSDSLDVISIIYAAARMDDAEECLSDIAPQQPADTTISSYRDYEQKLANGEIDPGTVRIGLEEEPEYPEVTEPRGHSDTGNAPKSGIGTRLSSFIKRIASIVDDQESHDSDDE